MSLRGGYGVTDPVSTKPPDPKDNELTKKLEEQLKQYNVFESDADLRHRMEVLHKIDSLFKEWIKKISINKVYIRDLLIINHASGLIDFVKSRIYQKKQQLQWVAKFAHLVHLD